MPRKDKIWMQERILLSDPLGARALLTSIAVGCVGSGGSLIDCEGIHSPELKDIICGTVTRKYNGIESSEIYNHILRTLIENNFQILESDGDVGRIYSRYEKGIVKKFLIWEWKQRYTVICELRPKLTNPADVYFIYNFNVKEKPPLTSEYVPIVSDKNAQEIKNSLLSSVDQFVINKGGSF